ncbi:MAG: response regulator transcription factor [Chloroflexia bacterium]|nr:response regulator transcription factor [Chloroflexia bacterium]
MVGSRRREPGSSRASGGGWCFRQREDRVAGERVLVVDDEPQMRRALRSALTTYGYDVSVADGGVAALETIATWLPDAIVLDLIMPQVDGLSVLRDTRTWSSVPIIVLSARGAEADKVTALDQGADDYLTKPFGMPELLARLRAMLRRRTVGVADVLVAGNVTIDPQHYRVTRDGEEVHLTPTEFDLLRVLASEADRVLTHRQLLDRVWGSHVTESSQQLRVYINYLRRKLEADPGHPHLIVTEPGVGYRLRTTPAATSGNL